MKSFIAFLRSIVPADRWQLVYLAGLVCLTVAPRLRWGTTELAQSTARGLPGPSLWFLYSFCAVLVMVAGAAVGYAAVFWPGKTPVRRILLGCCLPVILGAAAMVVRNFYFENAGSTILAKTKWSIASAWRLLGEMWSFESALSFLVFGIILVAIFALRISMGLSRLPVAFAKGVQAGDEWSELPKRPKILLWLMIGPQSLFLELPSAPVFALLPTGRLFDFLFPGAIILLSLFKIAVALWIAGHQGRDTLKRFVRLPEMRWAGLGAAIPAGLALLISLGYFLHDRASWAAFDFGKLEAPRFVSYLPVPKLEAVLTLLFAAAFEEIIFRGILQGFFVRGYGMFRGIFLTSMAWAACHFYWDTRGDMGVRDWDVFANLIYRVAICLAIGYVLSWLTIRSESLLPPILAHWLSNVSLAGPSAERVSFPDDVYLRVALWAVVAVVLFRYWPLERDSIALDVDLSPEPVA